MLELAFINDISGNLDIKMMMLAALAFMDAKTTQSLAINRFIYRETKKSYDNLPEITLVTETEEEKQAKEWLYRTEFDEYGNVVHCNAFSQTKTNVKTEQTFIGENNYDADEMFEDYKRRKQEEEEEMNFTPSYTSNPSTQQNRVTAPTYNSVDKEKDLAEGLKELEAVTGLQPVKEFVYELKDMVEINRERQQVGQYVSKQALHMIFEGNPGTGKTTVARIVGKIMRGLNVIEKGHFVEVSREDLVVDYVGGTAKKTREVLEKAIGGVLFIDEAYSLARGGQQDFGKEAIDTIVKFAEDHKDDLIVILAGYTKEMGEFLKVNSGLKSRFPNVIEFPDYTPEELLEISKGMIKKEFKMDQSTEKVVLEILTKKQIGGRNDTGNGRLARNVVQEAVRRQSKRIKAMTNKRKEDYYYLTPQDFGYIEESDFNLEEELSKVVGNEDLKNFIRSLESQVKIRKMRKEHGLSTKEQALHMIFKGNPGTGKTTIARIMGKMLKELGVVKSGHVVEVTREDLVAGYVGQTAEKAKEKIQEALGGILFIDEVYALNRGGENDFGKEAIDTLVKQMEEHYENLIVIIAGYEDETNEFLTANSGLKSRFPYKFTFKDYNLNEMVQIAKLIAKEQEYIIPEHCNSNLLHALLRGVEKREDGNGRYARTVIEKAQLNLSSRVAILENMLRKEDLQTFAPEDFRLK